MTAFVAVAALAGFFAGGEKPALQFDRDAIAAGELWRLWTAHALHFSGSHLGWSLAVLVPAGAWVEWAAARRARLFFVIAPAVIGVALLVFDPYLARYAGLSGLAAGSVALLAFTLLGRTMGSDRWFWWAVVGLLVAKIAIELFFPETRLARISTPDMRPVPLAHIAGIASAALVHGTRRRFQI